MTQLGNDLVGYLEGNLTEKEYDKLVKLTTNELFNILQKVGLISKK